MKHLHILLVLPTLFIALSCSADSGINNSEVVTKLLNHFIPNQVDANNSKKPEFKLGDFNGDGLEDIAVLITPTSKPVETKQLKIITPWVYPNTAKTNKYRKSLFIFQKTTSEWLSDKTKVFAILDTNGVLETPSFKLLTTSRHNKDYNTYASMLPVKTNNDFLILPTEAGIDTYIYWEKNTYKLYEPEEVP